MGLTVTTGLVDAVSVLGLGRVYTANMTGNIVIPRFSMLSCTALLCLRKSDRNGMFSHLSVL